MVVTTVLLLISVLVFPAVAGTIHSNQRRTFLRSLESMTIDAHNLAMSSQSSVTLQVDLDGHFTVQTVSTSTVDGRLVRTVTPPDGVQATRFVLAGNDVSDADWIVNFYADGTADSAGVEITANGAIYSMSIDPHQGRGLLSSSELPDATVDRWPAGDNVQRS